MFFSGKSLDRMLGRNATRCSVFLSIDVGDEIVEEHSDNDIEEQHIANEPVAHKEE